MLVAGGGPVGLIVAALLGPAVASGRLRIRVLDAGAAPAFDPACTDLRVYALSRASQRLLARLGVWDLILACRAAPYREMSVWQGEDPDGPASLRFEAAEIGEPDLGHIVEDVLLRRELGRAARARGVEILHETGVAALERRRAGIGVTTTTGARLQADLLIGADGGDSTIRRELGFAVLDRAYGQHAVVTHVVSSQPHRETARQRFLPGGPLAFLPLADGRCSIVWSLPSAEAERLVAGSEAAFAAALEPASAGVLGALEVAAPRARFPLRFLHAVRYCGPGVALVGDAAHLVHPLAGQGMNLGFLDASCLAEVVVAALERGEHPGDCHVLERYERRRKAANLSMQLALDGLERLFGLGDWAAPLRALGLAAVAGVPPLKHLLMRRALGLEAVAKDASLRSAA